MRKKRAQKGGEICRAEATGCGFARHIVFCDDVWLPDYKLPAAHFFIQTVGNGNHRPIFSGAPERIQNLLLCAYIEVRRDFIQQQNRRLRCNRPGNGQKLPLSL